jgi:hypothetical protein
VHIHYSSERNRMGMGWGGVQRGDVQEQQLGSWGGRGAGVGMEILMGSKRVLACRDKMGQSSPFDHWAMPCSSCPQRVDAGCGSKTLSDLESFHSDLGWNGHDFIPPPAQSDFLLLALHL